MNGIVKKKTMKWSKIRKNVQDNICDDLKKVIDVQMTWYHSAHDWVWEAYVTLNKKKIYWAWYYKWLMKSEGVWYEGDDELMITDEEVLKNAKTWTLDTSYIMINLREYRNYAFEDLITTNNPILKAFMVVDRRLGKRKFQTIVIDEDESEIVKIFYELRKELFNLT